VTACEVFNQNDGEVTKAYYADMNQCGPEGQLCVALFRAQKRSAAAKRYRGHRFKQAAYSVKNYSLGEICRILTAYPELNLRWGWKVDGALEARGDPHHQVLYVEIPQGQVSFHSEDRLQGPDYSGEWDGKHESAERILAYCDSVAASEGVREEAYTALASKAEMHASERKASSNAFSRYERELARGGGRLAL
jgi:hypothetical protein